MAPAQSVAAKTAFGSMIRVDAAPGFVINAALVMGWTWSLA
jgi:hypothetical protein